MKRSLLFGAATLVLAGIVYAQSIPNNTTSPSPTFSGTTTTGTLTVTNNASVGGNGTITGTLGVTGTTTTRSVNTNGALYVDGGVSAQVYTSNQWDGGAALAAPSSSKLCLDGASCTRYVWFDSANSRLKLTAPVSDYINFNRFVELDNGIGVSGSISIAVNSGTLVLPYTDSSGTAGAATINKISGMSAVANGAGSVDISNDRVDTTSRVFITPLDTDTTCVKWKAVPTSGHITVTCNAGPTADFKFQWLVIN